MKTNVKRITIAVATATVAGLGLAVPASAATADSGTPSLVQFASHARPGVAVTPDSPTSGWSFLDGSAVSTDGCKAWMNYATDTSGGFYTRGLLESWGNDCEMHYARSGPSPFDDFRVQNGAGTLQTNGYWDGPGYATKVCVWEIGHYSDYQCSPWF